MDQRIKQSGSEPTYILQIYMIFVNKDDKMIRKKTFGVVFFLHLLLKRGKESVRIFKRGYYERDRTGKI